MIESRENTNNDYDDGNIPEIDLPSGTDSVSDGSLPNDDEPSVEPLPESTRPREDGPGGN